jgi:hypothetical protein
MLVLKSRNAQIWKTKQFNQKSLKGCMCQMLGLIYDLLVSL